MPQHIQNGEMSFSYCFQSFYIYKYFLILEPFLKNNCSECFQNISESTSLFQHSAEIEPTGCSRCNQLNPVEEGMGQAGSGGGGGGGGRG